MIAFLRFLFVACALCIAYPAFAQPQADELFQQGRSAIVKKDWGRARDLLKQSWDLRQTFDTAALLGQAESKLDAHRDAAEHLEFALRNFPHQDPAPDARRRITEAFEAAKLKVFTAKITVAPEGAEVVVDGTVVGRSPLPAEVFFDIGAHIVEAKLDGYETAKREIDARAGARETIALELVKTKLPDAGLGGAGSGTPVPGGPQPHDGGTDDHPKKSMVPAYVAGGVAAIGLIGAIVFELGRSSKVSDAEDLRKKVGKGGCASGTPQGAGCDALHDTNADADRNERWRNVSAGVFVAGAATAVVWLLLPGPKKDAGASRRLRIAPAASRAGGSFFVTGTF